MTKYNQIDYSLLIISLFTVIYLIDDIKKLNFILRIFLQLCSGFLIAYLSFSEIDTNILIYFLFLGMLFMFIATNLFNFNDGANLHVSILFLIILISFYFFGDFSSDIFNQSVLFLILFIFIFMIFNHFNLLYFGDSGCFLFSIFILSFLIKSQSIYNIFLFLSIISLYILDAIYVFILRIKNKENLLSRNYHHLYQKIEIKHKNYTYLIPGFTLGTLSSLYFINFPYLHSLAIIYFVNGVIYLTVRKIILSD